MSSVSQVSRIGAVVEGKYRVVRLLGAGGMSEVYEARHLELQRRAAIKFLLPEVANEPTSVARFQREARTAGALQHENVAACYDAGVDCDGSPYLVMEFLEGADCAEVLRSEGYLGRARAIDLVMQICRGASAAHAYGIVHRDLKPANLFLCRRGDGSDLVKVLDFGIAQPSRAPDAIASTAHGAIGTPHYMSPEQARGDRAIDARSDIYSLGVILYEFLCGQKPHDGSSALQILHRIATREPPRLQSLRRDLPVALCEVVERAMAKEPAERFDSMEAFLRALQPFAATTARGRRSAAVSSSVETPSGPPTVSTEDVRTAQPLTVERSVARSRRRIAGLPAAILAIVGVAVLWAGLRNTRPHSAELRRTSPQASAHAQEREDANLSAASAAPAVRSDLSPSTGREPNASERSWTSPANTFEPPAAAPSNPALGAVVAKKPKRASKKISVAAAPAPVQNAEVTQVPALVPPPTAAFGRLQIDSDNPYRRGGMQGAQSQSQNAAFISDF